MAEFQNTEYHQIVGSDVESKRIRSLWAAVFLSALSDARLPKDCLERHKARRWIGGKDFFLVCNLSGIDGHAALERLQDLRA